MIVRVLAVLALLLALLYGCAQSTPAPGQRENKDTAKVTQEPTKKPDASEQEASAPVDVPDYALTKDEKGMMNGLRVRNISASTDATSERDLEAITQDLWAKESNADAMIVSFYPDEPAAEVRETSEAYRSRKAARIVISAMYPPPEPHIEERVRQTMANGGIRIVSRADEITGMN
jgi:hypothetical protein